MLNVHKGESFSSFIIKFKLFDYIMGGSKTQCASTQQDRHNLNLNKSAAFAPSMVNVRNVHQVKRYQNMSNYNLKMSADYNDSAPCDSNHDSAFQQDATMDPAFARKTMELYQRE